MKKNMKKLWALVLATMLSVVCIGCSEQTESKKNTRESIDVQTETDGTPSNSESVVASDLWEDSSVAKKVDEINSLIDKYYYFDVDRWYWCSCDDEFRYACGDCASDQKQPGRGSRT